MIGPRGAVLAAVIGGFLFLPAGEIKLDLSGFVFALNKWNVNGLALILGCLIFDRRTVLQVRPCWLDLPMAAYYLAPLIGLVTGVPGSSVDITDIMIGRGLGWIVAYVMGRIYFSRDNGPAEVAFAVVLGGLVYVPVCIYEEIAGPQHYLATLVYGIASSGNVDRLGGWRPNGFLGDGLVLASWMALTAVTATWLWLGHVRSGHRLAGMIALLLVVTTLSCRGVYGYLLLAAGLATAVLSRWLRARAFLVCLSVIPILYMGLRMSGAWGGWILVNGADFTGRSSTVAFRLLAEEDIISRVIGNRPVFGFGSYIWNTSFSHWPDGGWLHILWMGGLAGVALWLLALMVVPVASAISRPLGGPAGRQELFPAWALACWCALQMLDSLHNTSYIPPLTLIAGTLVGYCSSLEPMVRFGRWRRLGGG